MVSDIAHKSLAPLLANLQNIVNNFEEKILTALMEEQYFDECYQLLMKAKDDGFSRSQVDKSLDVLLAKYDENENLTDRILEIKDITHNYCQPHYRVWI